MVKLRRFRMCFAFTLLMGMLVLLSGCSSTSSPSQTSSTVDCPLAVYLDFPHVSDYETAITAPVSVTGYVNKPQAKVTINEVEVKVGKNGAFSTKVQFKEGINAVEAVATLGEQTDSERYHLDVCREGIFGFPHEGFYQSILIFDRVIEMKAGETKILDVTFDVGKEIRQSEEFTYTISFVGKVYSEIAIPIPEGLDVIIEPSHFIGCPNMTYHSTLTFKTADTLTPGEYWFVFQQRTGTGGKTTSWILVTVQP